MNLTRLSNFAQIHVTYLKLAMLRHRITLLFFALHLRLRCLEKEFVTSLTNFLYALLYYIFIYSSSIYFLLLVHIDL
jgi:hypothetical protein